MSDYAVITIIRIDKPAVPLPVATTFYFKILFIDKER